MSPRLRRAVALAAAAVLIPLGVFLTISASAQPSSGGSFAVAPYVDMSNSQEGLLATAVGQKGVKAFTAAFVTGSGCTPIWGDTLPVTDDPKISGEISQATSAGAQVIVSFGGEQGPELAQSCTDLDRLVSAYQSVVKQFNLTHVDFDLEGAAIADTASMNLRFQAIAKLEAADSGLVVSLTIPAAPTGPDANGKAFLTAAKTDGARVDLVNLMTMDYYGSWDSNGGSMGAAATQAAQNSLSFVKTLWPDDTYADIGVTPMIGRNDDAAETFTTDDANSVVSFAESNGIGRLSFWSLDRDQPCGGAADTLSTCSETGQQALDFTGIFNQAAGAGPSIVHKDLVRQPPASGGASADPSARSSGSKNAGVPFRREQAQSLSPLLPAIANPVIPAESDAAIPAIPAVPAIPASPALPAVPASPGVPASSLAPLQPELPLLPRERIAASGSPSGALANPGFETGDLTGWTCDPGTGQVVTSPVHAGAHALEATPTDMDDANCSQTVAVQPGTTYTLSAWVQGPYAFIGDSLGPVDWASTGSWQQLSTTFATGPSTTSVTIYVHGWYAQGPVYADDFTLTPSS